MEPDELTGDHYQDALRELVAQKIKGAKPVVPHVAPAPSNVVNLMDALRKSVTGEDGAPARRAAASGAARARGAKHAADPAYAVRKPTRKRRAS
jgi:DNA end-binding protein Ku